MRARSIPSSADLLARLVAFKTVSRDSNLDLIGFARAFLDNFGFTTRLIPDATGAKANLLASLGPAGEGGVMLAGHTDVVPVDGQAWSSDPFTLLCREGRLYGRGAADMKGFLASALRAAALASRDGLARPLHLALSYDEEIGCVGVRSMLDHLADTGISPTICVVGEPTSLLVATGHKGKTALHATCRGRAAHSAMAPDALNAIHLATDLIDRLRRLQAELAASEVADPLYDIPYSTVHVGRIEGGTALNIVPDRCTLDFEFRTLATQSADALLQRVAADAGRIAAAASVRFPEAAIDVAIVNAYPGFEAGADAASVRLMRGLALADTKCKVAFGSEAGLYQGLLGFPTILCGPGSMEQGHKPDEFVTEDQLHACDRMLERLVAEVCR